MIELPDGKIGFWLIDVDGPLNPYSGTNKPRLAAGYKLRKITTDDMFGDMSTFRVWLNPSHGETIMKIAEEARLQPVWATTWEHRANEQIAFGIGLKTPLPVIKFGPGIRSALWKIPGILNEIPQGVPIIWSDDDFRINNVAVDYLLEHRRSGLTALHTVSPRTGFTAEDFEYVREWGARLREPDEEQACAAGDQA